MALPTSVATKTQSVFPPRAITYVTGATTGSTINLPRQFHGIGALLAVSVPLGKAVSAYMLPPTGPRSKGNPPRATLTIASGPSDVVLTEV